ncbi:MAG: hypothetical protein COU90_01920 [Candidatus Ryanbacteria bacterium CG10_big_fil_rev_8_21_14_0_10_43_42]|uniref:NodB homology domain-containing protein n=1 Tax=Candidatus Ryanbacteria bacterium CG10_big_fil_rev_8_21_14_0_10_43_42 TaxID=1974864 RepID=A0A2M8KXB5_9BACT|nr:MAG: hypothetical protein COU90_01920 [Candidatus Ryanbacteria bacterium CG10_big_fil_rev_8_21_14_0_10_43_42]
MKLIHSIFWSTVYYSGINALYQLFFRPRLTVLGYHSVSDAGSGELSHRELYHHLSVPREQFEQQMVYLQKKNYSFLSLSDLIAIQKKEQSMPSRAVFIYFDDGYRDNLLNAYPILKQYNIPATIFLITDCINQKKILWESDIDPYTAGIFLTWDEVNQMKDICTFGTHTVSHRKLTSLSGEDIKEEYTASKREIEEKTDRPVLALSYPKSRTTKEAKRIAGELFPVVLAHGRGFAHSRDLHYLWKIPVDPQDSMMIFYLKLGIYYPFMNALRTWKTRL